MSDRAMSDRAMSDLTPLEVPPWIEAEWQEASASANGESASSSNGHALPKTEGGFVGDRGGVVAPKLAQHIKHLGRVVVGLDSRLWRYRAGVYRPDGDAFARVKVREALGDRCTKKGFDEVLAWLRADFPSVGEAPPEEWLNVQNGLLDWRTGELLPHDPEVLSTVQLPVAWNPAATCPANDRFRAEVLPADARDLVDEIAGYTAYAGNPLRRAVLYLGTGRNGKSAQLGVHKALLGPDNIATVPLQVLAENRFAAAELFGKLANISGDLDARAIRQTDVFKMATGGDAISAERKYGQAFSFTPFATFLFAANEAPISSDQSEAWFDRWLVVPFDYRVPDERIDPHLLAKLTTPSELEGVLVRAVDGLRRLLERGRFALPGSVHGAGERYRDRLDTVRGFVAEVCTLRPDAWVARPALYGAYRKWAQEGGRLPVSAVTFNDHLRGGYPMQVEERTRRGTRGWGGLGIVTEEEP